MILCTQTGPFANKAQMVSRMFETLDVICASMARNIESIYYNYQGNIIGILTTLIAIQISIFIGIEALFTE